MDWKLLKHALRFLKNGKKYCVPVQYIWENPSPYDLTLAPFLKKGENKFFP